MAKKSGKYIFKKGIVLTIVMLFYALFRVQIIHQTIQNNNRKEEKSPKNQK